MSTITPHDTNMHFMGSGALSYEWWHVTETVGDAFEQYPAENWSITVREYDPDHGTFGEQLTTFDHKTLMRAINTLARTASDNIPRGMSDNVLRECRTFIADHEDADFDADSADQVLQFIAFGEVTYG